MLEKTAAMDLMAAQQELILLKYLNMVESTMLEAISEGLNLCNVEKLPDWVANTIRSEYGYEVTQSDNYTQIVWAG